MALGAQESPETVTRAINPRPEVALDGIEATGCR